MPNVVEPIRNQILAEHPEATVHARTSHGLTMRIADAPDGRRRFVLTSCLGSLHYHDGQGYQEINTDWLASDDAGFVDFTDRAAYRLYSDANGRRRIYPRREVTNEYVEFARPQYYDGAWKDLPVGSRTRSGDTLTWDRPAFGLKLQLTPSGLRKEIVLKTSQAARRIRWPVSLTGLSWSDWTLVSNADASVVARVGRPLVTADASGPLTEPRAIECSYANGAVEFTADLTGLTFPVTIDPTVDVQVSASADDAQENSAGSVSTNAGSTHLNSAFSVHAAFRVALAIDQGVTVDVAYATYNVPNTSYDSPDGLTIVSEAVNSAAAYQANNYDISGRTYNGSPVTWNGTDIGTGWKNSPSLVGPVQAVLNRAGWSSGNYIAIKLAPRYSYSTLLFYTRDAGSTLGPKLHIEYTEAVTLLPRLSLLGVG